jgi:multisubunit Na+/H+ antiporter MnhC subunit
MRRVVFWILAALASPFVVVIGAIVVGFALTLGWLVGDDE